MRIEINNEQFKQMLIGAMLYSWIYGGLADREGEDFQKFEEPENFLLGLAEKEGLTDLYERFRGHLLPNDKFSSEVDETIEEYEDDSFWHELTTRLGKRDFWRSASPKEKKETEKRNWLPDRVHNIYEKYDKEFEEYGIDRLEIKHKTENPK